VLIIEEGVFGAGGLIAVGGAEVAVGVLLLPRHSLLAVDEVSVVANVGAPGIALDEDPVAVLLLGRAG
jgi:hypothetical protein